MTNDCEDVYGEFTSLYVLGDLDTAAEAAGRAMIGRPAELRRARRVCRGLRRRLERARARRALWRSAQFRD